MKVIFIFKKIRQFSEAELYLLLKFLFEFIQKKNKNLGVTY